MQESSSLRRSLFTLAGIIATASWLISDHYPPWESFYTEFAMAIALMVLAAASLRLRERLPFSLPYPATVLLLLVTVPLLQYVAGLIHFFGDAGVASLYLAGLALAYLVGFRLASEDPQTTASAIAWMLFAAALLSFFLALVQVLKPDLLGIWLAPSQGLRATANLGQSNHLAILLCLGITAVIYLNARGRLSNGVAVLVALVFAAGTAMTASRAPFIIALALGAWVLWRGNAAGLRLKPRHVAMGLAVLTTFWLLWPGLYDAYQLNPAGDNPIATGRVQGRLENSFRLTMWNQLFDAAARKPLTGYGWNQVSLAQVAVAAEHPPSPMTEHSHNLILDLMIWNGMLPGILLFIVLGWWILSRTKRCIGPEAWFGLAAILIVLTHHQLEFPLEYTYFLLPIGLCAGLVDRLQKTPYRQLPAWVLPGLVVTGSVMLGILFADYRQAEEDFRLARFEQSLLSEKTPGEETAQTVLTQLSAYTRYSRTEARQGMSDAEITAMQTVAHRYPHPPAMMRYALALALNHRYQEAALELTRLVHLHPDLHEDLVQNWRAGASIYPDLGRVTLPESPESAVPSLTAN